MVMTGGAIATKYLVISKRSCPSVYKAAQDFSVVIMADL